MCNRIVCVPLVNQALPYPSTRTNTERVERKGNQVGQGYPGVWVWLGLVSGCVDVVLGVWVPAFG